MATSYLVLGQSVPTSGNSDLYTAAAATVVSTVAVCNTTATAATATIYIRKAGASATTSNALVYQQTIPANYTSTFTLGITLASTDVITVATGTSGSLTFHAFGSTIA
jgi:hypothetical protein